MRSRNRAAKEVAGVLAASLALAPGPVLPQAPPRFGTEAEIVTVDVVVLGPDGKPVPGLTRADFVVREDGRPQAITAFEAVEAVVPSLAAPATAALTASAARVATNVSAPATRRTFAVVFDDLHVGALNLEQARRALRAFLDRDVRPGDRVVLMTTSDARYWATTRGASDPTFLRALDGVASRRLARERLALQMSPVEAMRIADLGDCYVANRVRRRRAILSGLCVWTGDRCECSARAGGGVGPQDRCGGDDGCLVPPGAPGSEEAYTQARRSLQQTLRVLREAARRLGTVRERKTLVLVSEGFMLDPSFEGFRQIREECARSNVVLYFLDARGLAVGPEFLSAAGSTGTIPGNDIGPTLALWRLEDAGAKALAEETGGRVLQTNDLVGGLAQVAEESRVTYLLGYEPTNTKRDGRYRKLKVEVLRPGLEVRARAGYFAGKKAKKKLEPEPTVVDRVLGNPFDADGIPLRLAAYVMGPAPLQSPVPKTGVEVLVAGEVRLDAFERQVIAGRVVAAPRLKLFVSSHSRESHEAEWTLEVSLTPAAEAAEPGETWHPFLTRIAMEPGDHRARLVVESGGRVGSVTTDFLVPDFTEERLSTPILSDHLVSAAVPGASGGVMRVLPVVRRSFPSSSTLHVWVELHGAAVDPEIGQPRAAAAFVVRSADGREWAAGAATAMNGEAGKPTRLVSLPLAEAPTGENEIVLTVRDEVSGRSFAAREPFRVEPSPEADPAGAAFGPRGPGRP